MINGKVVKGWLEDQLMTLNEINFNDMSLNDIYGEELKEQIKAVSRTLYSIVGYQHLNGTN